MPPPPPLSPARVFAELVSPPVDSGTGEDEPARAALGGPLGREVHVSGSAELSAGPDRAKVTVYLRSRKGEAGAAQSSVARRLDYIAQTVRQRGGTSVCIIFTDFGKMQDTCNHLVEKLDKSVIISSPHFYHTVEAIDTLRRQVCVSAVRSAQQKAQEVCQLFGHSLGKPLLIKEEEAKESEGHLEDHIDNSSDLFSFQQKLQSATIYVSSRVFAIFEIKGEKKRKKAALIKVN
ncbi:interleukin-1 receptor-associated kinase 1-binding protein 1 isoform X2 [Crotalus tigris]|uniref:interleukin-1 receptor-associated kinase 1-binding protein 1 isoform X2 n=1 Tax=Crotalus tigris TaxID=88082 RepID=UPI00192FA5C7|nr:interleukin-1 receptor-associated kinase 1-binding protein 1 isoform X2 [Crotalus tigris]